jgi:hypothetical protein
LPWTKGVSGRLMLFSDRVKSDPLKPVWREILYFFF